MRNIYSPIEVDDDSLLLDDEKHELFYSKINALPQNIQDLLFSLDTEDKLKNIAVQTKLNQNQSIELTRLVRDVLINEIYLGDIIKESQKRLVVSEEFAREIANQIVSVILAPALEDIKKIHVEKFGRPAADVATPSNSKSQIPERDKPQIINPGNIVNLRNKN